MASRPPLLYSPTDEAHRRRLESTLARYQQTKSVAELAASHTHVDVLWRSGDYRDAFYRFRVLSEALASAKPVRCLDLAHKLLDEQGTKFDEVRFNQACELVAAHLHGDKAPVARFAEQPDAAYTDRQLVLAPA
jgi:hypothetical protein